MYSPDAQQNPNHLETRASLVPLAFCIQTYRLHSLIRSLQVLSYLSLWEWTLVTFLLFNTRSSSLTYNHSILWYKIHKDIQPNHACTGEKKIPSETIEWFELINTWLKCTYMASLDHNLDFLQFLRTDANWLVKKFLLTKCGSLLSSNPRTWGNRKLVTLACDTCAFRSAKRGKI